MLVQDGTVDQAQLEGEKKMMICLPFPSMLFSRIFSTFV